MGNYALAIKELEKDIMFEKQIHKQKIENMTNHLNYLKENNTICMKCEGNKFVLRTIDGNGNNLEKVECNVCHGTGKIKSDALEYKNYTPSSHEESLIYSGNLPTVED